MNWNVFLFFDTQCTPQLKWAVTSVCWWLQSWLLCHFWSHGLTDNSPTCCLIIYASFYLILILSLVHFESLKLGKRLCLPSPVSLTHNCITPTCNLLILLMLCNWKRTDLSYDCSLGAKRQKHEVFQWCFPLKCLDWNFYDTTVSFHVNLF